MKTKMKLNKLKVSSFVTDLDKQQAETAKGGLTPTVTWSVLYCTATITLTISLAVCSKDKEQPRDDHQGPVGG